MNLTMHGSYSRGNPPSYDSRTRTTGVSLSGSSRTTRNYPMGTSGSTSSVTQRTLNSTTYGSSYGSSSSFSSSRKLPKGPGPLPDRFTFQDRHTSTTNGGVRYVSPSDRYSTSKTNTTYFPAKTSSCQRNAVERKTSNDSGYGSSSSFKNPNGSTLAGRRSKSYSHLDPSLSELSIKDEPSPSKMPYSSKTIPSSTTRTDYSHGMSSRTKTQENITKLDENHNIYMPSRYSTDSEPLKRSTNNHFPSSSTKSSSPTSILNTSPSPKNRSVILDYNENRKEMISATPTSLRRNSKSSTSSSSPSTPNGRGSTDGLFGLRNLGNTCFMNSILQCLSQSLVLTEYMLNGSYTKQINSKSSMKGKLIQAYAELIKSMWKQSHSETGTAISPLSFKTQIQRFAPRFVGYNQQDAQEFLRFLLEGLHDDLNSVHNKPKYKICEFNDSLSDTEKAEKSWKHYLARDNSKITDLFVGQLKSTLKCTECGHKSVTFDPFWDLSLPIPRKSSSSYNSIDRSVTIQNCMELFAKEEVLDGDERPTCEKCKKKRKSTKKFTIQRFPRILVLHLKRFSGFGFRSKLQTNVDFPTDTKLDLKQFSSDYTDSKTALYSLFAVSNHSGTTYGGHYTAYCKHPLSHEWHCFNDSSVDNIPASRIGGPQAYILFYNRVDAKSSL